MIFIESKHLRDRVQLGQCLVVNGTGAFVQGLSESDAILTEYRVPILYGELSTMVAIDDVFIKLLKGSTVLKISETILDFGWASCALVEGKSLETFVTKLVCLLVVPDLSELEPECQVDLTVKPTGLEIDTLEVVYNHPIAQYFDQCTVRVNSTYLRNTFEKFKGTVVKIYMEKDSPLCIESSDTRLFLSPYVESE